MADSARKTSLTGIKPTGDRVTVEDGGSVHLGNYLGAIRPALKLVQQYDSIYFIADYHGLTTQKDPSVMRDNVRDVAACWLACGLDPQRTLLFRQSAVPQVFELTWVFACLVATGQLERGHAYKDAVGRGDAPNAGIFNYPLLMAADIILYDSHVVPVGPDQRQHLELARDVATRLNHQYGEDTVVVPQTVDAEAVLVPGLDGRKMSKSYGNAIPLFLPQKRLRKAIMKYKSDSTPMEESIAADGALVHELYKVVAGAAEATRMAERLKDNDYGWGHAKQELFEALDAHLSPMRDRYAGLRSDPAELDRVLEQGAERARAIGERTMGRVRKAIGID